ncbi:MAG: hypothetical protein GY898_31655 [Proteobacteria bacterium]|nr:hypothetical protein [Pseudomonadota bacterium]
MVANLRGEAENPARLDGVRLPLEHVFPVFVQLKVGPLVQYIVTLEAMLAYMFDEPERAVERGHFMEEMVGGLIQGLAVPQALRLWYRALAALDCPDAAERMEAVKEDRALLAGWAERAPTNHAHRVALLDAEIARVEARPLEAISGSRTCTPSPRTSRWPMSAPHASTWAPAAKASARPTSTARWTGSARGEPRPRSITWRPGTPTSSGPRRRRPPTWMWMRCSRRQRRSRPRSCWTICW